jgi:hypothetical protein
MSAAGPGGSAQPTQAPKGIRAASSFLLGPQEAFAEVFAQLHGIGAVHWIPPKDFLADWPTVAGIIKAEIKVRKGTP